MRRTPPERSAASSLRFLGGRIGPRPVRRLFVRFCREVARFSDAFEPEVSPFEVRLRDRATGFSVTLSPLRDLFLVSIGEDRALDVRVSSEASFTGALDLALVQYLETASRVAPS